MYFYILRVAHWYVRVEGSHHDSRAGGSGPIVVDMTEISNSGEGNRSQSTVDSSSEIAV